MHRTDASPPLAAYGEWPAKLSWPHVIFEPLNIFKTMFEIDNAVKKLDIEDGFKPLLSACISAEIFNLKKTYNPEVAISKHTQPNDDRVWCEVSLVFSAKDIALAQCRPFIDKGVSMSAVADKVFMRKTYFLYTV